MTIGDEADYSAIATNLAQGNGFAGEDGKVTGRRPPLYPLVLSIVYRATGPLPAAARLFQILLGLVVVVLVYALACRVFGKTVAAIAAGIVAINPFLVFISCYLLTENLYMVLVLGAILCFTPPDKGPPWDRLIAGALLLGLAALTRPTGLALSAWVLLAVLIAGRSGPRAKLRRFAVAAVVLLAVSVPWMIRNAVTFGGWVGLTTHGGITFYQGNNEKVVEIEHYRGGVAPVGALPRYEEFATMGERERDAFTYAAGRAFLRGHLREVPRLVWWKFKRLWRLESDMGLSGIRSGWWFDRTSTLGRIAGAFDAGLVYALVVFPFFVAGLILTRARSRDLSLLYGVIFVHTFIALAFFGSIRSRIPIEPVIAIFAAAAFIQQVRALRSR